MSIITKDIIDAIAYAFEPTEASMTERQRIDFLKCIEGVCDKELEARQLRNKWDKIKTLEHLITVCIENDNKDTKKTLMDELLKLM